MKRNNEYARVKTKEISITMEKADRSDKIKVWGCFHGKDENNFIRYFDDLIKASEYYDKQLRKAAIIHLIKTSK